MALLYLNGEIVDERDAHISVNDRGFVFADGIYEVIRVFAGKPFEMERHLDRLDVAGTLQDCGGDGLADGQHHAVDNLTQDGGRHLLLAGSHGAPQPGKAARRCGKEVSSYRPLPALRPSWPGGGSCRPR